MYHLLRRQGSLYAGIRYGLGLCEKTLPDITEPGEELTTAEVDGFIHRVAG